MKRLYAVAFSAVALWFVQVDYTPPDGGTAPAGGTGSGVVYKPDGSGDTLLNDLIFYVGLNELSGTRAKTAGSCASCDFTAVNAPTAAGGAGGKGVQTFTTGSKYLVSTAAPLQLAPTTSWSVFSWAQWSADSITKYLVAGIGGAAGGWDLYRNVVTLTARGFTGGSVSRCTFNMVTANNARYFVGVGFDRAVGANGTLYGSIDGATWGSSSACSAVIDAATGLGVGANTAGVNPGNNLVDSTMVYGVKVSNTIIASLYNGGAGKKCTDLTAAEKVNLIACYDYDGATLGLESGIGSCGATCDLTLVNTPTAIAGLVQNTMGMSAFSIAASTQALNLNDNADISISDEDYTVACWASSSALANTIIIDKTDEYRLGADASSKPYAKMGDTDIATWADAATANTWMLVAGGFDSVNSKAWVSMNGGTRVEAAETSTPVDTANALRIFSTSAGGSYWAGAVDACALWKRNVSDAGLLAWYASGVGVEYSSSAWGAITASLFGVDRELQWADRSIEEKQWVILGKYGVWIPEAMFPSRKVYVR